MKFPFTLVAAAFLLAPALAGATDVTTSMEVTASVLNSCSVTATTMAFGAYDQAAAAATAGTATLSVTCTLGTDASIRLGQGLYAESGSTDAVPLRRLNAARAPLSGSPNTAFLNYFLWHEVGHTTVWGNNLATGTPFTATAGPDVFTVFGTITELQAVPSGDYRDTVLVSVDF